MIPPSYGAASGLLIYRRRGALGCSPVSFAVFAILVVVSVLVLVILVYLVARRWLR
jgi:hypothetical protein